MLAAINNTGFGLLNQPAVININNCQKFAIPVGTVESELSQEVSTSV